MSFKRLLIWSSSNPPVHWTGTVYVILKEGIKGNIHVKLFEIWTSGSGVDVVSRKSLGMDGQRPITIAHLESSA